MVIERQASSRPSYFARPKAFDLGRSLAFLESHIAERGANAETIPYTPEQIRDLFLERLVVEYDYVFCMTITGSRSPIFANAQKASYMILND